jgi:hypothetical protein
MPENQSRTWLPTTVGRRDEIEEAIRCELTRDAA